MLGIPLEDGRRLYELTEILNSGYASATALLSTAVTQMFQYGTELAARKRADPGDDIATSLLHAEVDGQSLTDFEFNLFFILLMNAGGDTTRNLVAAGILALMQHPAERQRLEADPSLMPTAIEEMLRYRPRSRCSCAPRPKTPNCTAYPSRRASGRRCSTRRPTAMKPDSPIPTASILAGTRILISPSAEAEPTSASARTSRAWKPQRSSPRCCHG